MENKILENRTNKVAIITGGSRGLGRNTAVNLARRGVDVIFTYRSNQTEAENLIREFERMGRKAAAFRLDTGDIRSCAITRNGTSALRIRQHWDAAAYLTISAQ